MVKQVSWAQVCELSISLTNQLSNNGVPRPGLSYLYDESRDAYQGERQLLGYREEAEHLIPLPDLAGCWYGFKPDQVDKLVWTSRRSKSQLVASKNDDGSWALEFVPSPEDPEYRGWYWQLFSNL